ncbi:hypothetical protein Q7P37_005932 [Cladosporium fusiforme]
MVRNAVDMLVMNTPRPDAGLVPPIASRTMEASDPKTSPGAASNDTRKFIILYGSLGTLIAFFSLVFAAISWWKSRSRTLAARRSSNHEHELESNASGGSLSGDSHTAALEDIPARVVPSGNRNITPVSAVLDNSPGQSWAESTITVPYHARENDEADLCSIQTTPTVIDPSSRASSAGTPLECIATPQAQKSPSAHFHELPLRISSKMLSLQLVAAASLLVSVSAQTSSTTSSSAAAAPTEVTGCHTHGEDIYCVAGSDEWELTGSEFNADNVPDSFQGCHMHGDELHCADGDIDATFVSEDHDHDHSDESDDHDHDHDHAETTSASSATATAASNGTVTSSTLTTSSTSSALPTAVTSCHTHDETELYCLDDGDEWRVTSDWDSEDPPKSFDDCHSHGEELHCVDGDNDATIVAATEAHTSDDDASAGSTTSSSASSSSTADADSAASESFGVSSMSMLVGGVLLAYAAV